MEIHFSIEVNRDDHCRTASRLVELHLKGLILIVIGLSRTCRDIRISKIPKWDNDLQ